MMGLVSVIFLNTAFMLAGFFICNYCSLKDTSIPKAIGVAARPQRSSAP
jgi:hypothetical protein